MYGFHVWYDVDKKQFFFDEERTETGQTTDFNKWFADRRSAQFAAERMNRFSGVCIKKCPQCGRLFWFDADDQYWYKKNGLKLPKRCIVCRRMNKEAKKHETL